MDIEDFTDEMDARLSKHNATRQKLDLITLSDLGEIFVRTPDGSCFKLTVEEITADDVAESGLDFDD